MAVIRLKCLFEYRHQSNLPLNLTLQPFTVSQPLLERFFRETSPRSNSAAALTGYKLSIRANQGRTRARTIRGMSCPSKSRQATKTGLSRAHFFQPTSIALPFLSHSHPAGALLYYYLKQPFAFRSPLKKRCTHTHKRGGVAGLLFQRFAGA